MNIAFTANYQGIQTTYAGTSFAVAGVQIPVGRLLAFVLSVVVTVALVAVMNLSLIHI